MENKANTSSSRKFLSLLTCVIAIGIRVGLMFSKYQVIIANHIEVSSPLNSWKRVSEGLYLLSKNINPYNGDLLHENPLSLHFYKLALELFKHQTELMFITFDILTGILLYFTSRKFIKELAREEETNKHLFAEDAKEYLITSEDISFTPIYVTLAFFFNPFTIFNCVGCSTSVIFYFFLSIFLCSMAYGQVIISSISLAICTSVSFYPFVLSIPLALYFLNIAQRKDKAILSVLLFAISSIGIHLVCSNFGQEFQYLRNVYGFILTVPDLQPNIGLFWYFFTEMFDHFRELFIYSFQINATILYLVPLSIKFRKQPFLLTCALLFLIAVFKSYPCIGDVGFVLSLLPCFVYLSSFGQQGFLVSVIFLITSALAPILWYLWIYCNSANANFYFGVTLAFAIAQIFLVTDVLFAQVKREFCLKHGKNKTFNSKDCNLALE